MGVDIADVHMYHGYQWWQLETPCPHDGPDVRFLSLTDIGSGPNVATYRLVERECACRAWMDQRARDCQSGERPFWESRMQWFAPPHDPKETPA